MARMADRALCRDEHAERSWVERDAAVVWHGFTQMATYADNAPVVVERAEGHYLFDADGNRYLDAISSLWVTTLGHRVPELDAALRDQIDRGAHTTMLGNGNQVDDRARRGARARRPGRRSALPLRGRRCERGRAGPEDRVPVLGQRRRRGPHDLPRVRRRLPRRHDRRALGRRRRLRHRPVRPAAVPRGARARLHRSRSASTARSRCVAEHAARARRGDRRAARAGRRRHAPRRPGRRRPARRRVPRPRRAAHLRRGRDRLRPHRHALRVGAVRHPPRPPVPRQGPHRGLPRRCRRRSRAAGCSTRSSATTSARARSTTGTRTAGTRSPRAVALRHLELLEAWDVLANVRARSDELRGAPHRPRRAAPRGRRGAPARADGWRRARAADATACAGGGASAPRRCERGVLLRPLGDVVVLMPPLTVTSEEIDEIVARARRRDRRGHARDATWRGVGRAPRPRRIHDAGQWRAPRDLDAAGPEGTPRPRRPRRRVVRVQRLPRPHPAPRGGGRGPRRARPLGHRIGIGPADRRLPPGAHRARARARRLEAHARRPCCSPPASPPTSACSPPSAAPSVLVVLRRAQPRVDHRRLPPLPLRGHRLPPRRPRPRRPAPGRGARPSGDRRDRHRLLDGRRRRAGRRPRRGVRPRTARCSCSTRPTRCSAPIPTSTGRSRRAARRHAVEDPRVARRLRRRAPRASPTCS